MSLTAYERESAVWFTDDSSEATFYTCNRSWMTRLDKMVESHPDTYKLKREIKDEDGIVVGKEYILPKKLISVRTPSTRTISEEQRQAGKRALDEYRKNKQKNEV